MVLKSHNPHSDADLLFCYLPNCPEHSYRAFLLLITVTLEGHRLFQSTNQVENNQVTKMSHLPLATAQL